MVDVDEEVVLLSSKANASRDTISVAAIATEATETPPNVTPTCGFVPAKAAPALIPLVLLEFSWAKVGERGNKEIYAKIIKAKALRIKLNTPLNLLG